jgi:hypothetical protein
MPKDPAVSHLPGPRIQQCSSMPFRTNRGRPVERARLYAPLPAGSRRRLNPLATRRQLDAGRARVDPPAPILPPDTALVAHHHRGRCAGGHHGRIAARAVRTALRLKRVDGGARTDDRRAGGCARLARGSRDQRAPDDQPCAARRECGRPALSGRRVAPGARSTCARTRASATPRLRGERQPARDGPTFRLGTDLA